MDSISTFMTQDHRDCDLVFSRVEGVVLNGDFFRTLFYSIFCASIFCSF